MKLLAWTFLGVRLVAFIHLFVDINATSYVYIDVMPHSKKTTVQQTNDRNMTKGKANASAKSKEVQPKAQTDPQLHHICFCPNRTTTTFIIH